MSIGSGLVISRRASVAGYFAGALALAAVAMAGSFAAHATERLQLKTAIPPPAGGTGKITSFDISFVDTATHTYILGDRTNNGVDVIDSTTNTLRFIAGHNLFTGAQASNDVSGPDGVMVVNNPATGLAEIWAGDGDSTLKILDLTDGTLLATIPTGDKTQNRVDEMCFDPVNSIGFVANNAADPPFITAIDAGSRQILGQIFFKPGHANNNGAPLATNGIEQCQFNPRDNKIYVTVPEINGPGNNSAAGGVSRINPVTLQVEETFVIPHPDCAGPQGLAIGPLVGNYGEMLTGCNGAVANAGPQRPTALIDDGSHSPGGHMGRAIGVPYLRFQAGNDMITFNGLVTSTGTSGGDNHYYMARSGNNALANPAPNPITLVCPSTAMTQPYGGNVYVGGNLQGPSFGNVNVGPQVVGMINALTLENGPDTVTGLTNCAPLNPHGAAHSVAADPTHNQIYVPIPSTAVNSGLRGLCTQALGDGADANGCIAVFVPVGSDP